MDTIEKRASEKFPVCTCDKEFEEEYFKPQRDFYIKVATEQREIDIQHTCDWLEEHLYDYLASDGPMQQYYIQQNKLIEDFRKAMKGE